MTWHNKKNLFQIWKDNAQELPFAAWIDSWSKERYTIVEEIKVQKWPYGIARGYPTVNGVPSEIYDNYPDWKRDRIIPNSGVYRWEQVPVKLVNGIYVKDNDQFSGIKVAGNAKLYSGESIFNFGKYKGKTVAQVMVENKSYIKWLVLSVNTVVFEEQCLVVAFENNNQEDREVITVNTYKLGLLGK
jgi:hypothetical protein